jgi:hypothetical protein
VTGESRHAGQYFNEAVAQLYSKTWSANFLKSVLRRREQELAESVPESWLCTENEVGMAVNTLDGALQAIDRIRARGHHRIVVKKALGLAGQNAIRLWEPALLETQRRWLAKATEQAHELVVEPWLERVTDFSVQLEMTAEGLKLRGFTGLVNDLKGQFRANWAAPNYLTRCPAQIVARLAGPPDISSRLHSFYRWVISLLEAELRRADYLGPLGIDSFIYRTDRGEMRMKPIVEINPRYTMGRLLTELMAYTAPGGFGIFRLVNRAILCAEGFQNFVAYAGFMKKRFPVRLEGVPVPRIREGALCLNDPDQARSYLGIFRVSPAAGEILNGTPADEMRTR